MSERPVVTKAVITALAIETHAVLEALDDAEEFWLPDDPNYYWIATAPSLDPHRRHSVVVVQLARDGTRNAAGVGADLVRTFPELRVLIMCGIAGGVPDPRKERDGVHLGDIVVATEGVVDYGHVRAVDGTDTPRRQLNLPSAELLRVDNKLHLAELRGTPPWLETVEKLGARPPFTRPGRDADVLNVGAMRRADDLPRVHRGLVGSADRLLRDEVLRDQLAARHRILAVEMEASGVAVAAELSAISWFMVRGIADYAANSSKNDVWHPYAAMVAAAYLRSLLGGWRPDGSAARVPTGGPLVAGGPLGGLSAIVDALLSLPQLANRSGRVALCGQLPAYIATMIEEKENARLHVLSIVQTCAHFPAGEQALIDALAVILGAGSPDLAPTVATLRGHWPRT